MSNSSVGDLAWELQHPPARRIVRAVQVDLDYVYDPDPVRQELNLGQLLDRIKALGPTEVWLQAFADPDGEDSASAVYFPNCVLPMRGRPVLPRGLAVRNPRTSHPVGSST